MSDEAIKRLTYAVADRFRSFGGGLAHNADLNPLVRVLQDKPPMFAMGRLPDADHN